VIGPLLESLRPKQWTKNLLIFAGVLFSQQAGDPQLLLRAFLAFVAFSLLSSAIYLVNDIRDIESDRLHPRKRRRAIASGRLSVNAAWLALGPLVAVAGALVWRLGPEFTLVAVAYALMNLAYSFFLKNLILFDVFVIATGFVLRAIAGVEVLIPVSPETEISPWLLVCTFFGALFLALGKRRRELHNAGDDAARRREVLAHYTPELLNGLLLISAAASLMGYALYTIWPTTVAKFGTDRMLYTVPIVAYGLFRYLYLVQVSEGTEDPSTVLLVDRPLGICVLIYLAAVLAILYRA
jgi:4-hydroxybenzoate polyprenyltransferase